MPVIRVQPENRHLDCARRVNLCARLQQAGYYFSNNCGGQGRCVSCRIELTCGSLPPNAREKTLFGAESNYRLACQHTVAEDIEIKLISTDNWSRYKTIEDLNLPSDGDGFGIAIDLGTTIIAVYLLDLANGRMTGYYSALNPQLSYGSDVMTRLQAARDKNNLNRMTQAVRQCVKDGIAILLTSQSIQTSAIRSVMTVGNTVMTHLWLGIGGEGLENAPHCSPLECKGISFFSPAILGLSSDCRCELGSVLGGFVGGDTAAGIIAAGLDGSGQIEMLIDLGTSGEIVLSAGGQLWAASTAAGPAFEGVGMSAGMPAEAGAIAGFESVGTPVIIGNVNPAGYCGSGYISALSWLRRNCGLTAGGLLKRDSSGLRRWTPIPNTDTPLFITQGDVRKFQLAKAAIAAGGELLCTEANIDFNDISRIFITGSFGSRIDAHSAVDVGLLPRIDADRIQPITNAAGRGAALYLSRSDFRGRLAGLHNIVKTLNLAENPRFQECFTTNMAFPPLSPSGDKQH
ncbi:MAG: DUF4445 domain-containing protein [Calditrichaeota bacterium]|nr:DUF4445 domain-containing protein [Calditrichota bacterium]